MCDCTTTAKGCITDISLELENQCRLFNIRVYEILAHILDENFSKVHKQKVGLK